MVVTNATVTDHAKQEILRGEFINLLISNIEIILPAEKLL